MCASQNTLKNTNLIAQRNAHLPMTRCPTFDDTFFFFAYFNKNFQQNLYQISNTELQKCMAILKAINETEMSHFKVNELLPTKQTKWLRSKVNFQSNWNKWIKQKKI